MLNFWASWCGPCSQEAPGFERAARRWRKSIVTIVGLNVRDATSDARAWLRRYRTSYVVAHDGSDAASQLYGLAALPATFLISPQGRVVDHMTGFVSESELNRRISRALRRANA